MKTVLALSQTILLSLSYQVHAQQPAWMAQMLDRVNAERAFVSAPPLCYNDKLILAAEVHNQDMVDNNFLSHTGSDGSKPWDRVGVQGYNWQAVAENIAAGQTSVTQVMDAWMNSSGHRTNIQNPTYKHFGVAWDSGTNKWTQKFATSSSEVCAASLTPAPSASPTPVPSASPTIMSDLCNVLDVTGQTLFLPGVPGAMACLRVQLGPAGTLEGDTSDPQCSKDESSWKSNMGVISLFASANTLDNTAVFVPGGTSGISGTFVFKEDPLVTQPILELLDFDGSTLTFEAQVTIPTCSADAICPTMRVELF